MPQDGNKKGTAAIIGSIRTTTTTPTPPKKKEAPSQHLGLNRAFPLGWVGFSFLPPSEAGGSSSLTSFPGRQVLPSICTLFQV